MKNEAVINYELQLPPERRAAWRAAVRDIRAGRDPERQLAIYGFRLAMPQALAVLREAGLAV